MSETASGPVPGDEPMRVAVLGPGGVGGLLAGLLVRAGDRVTCLAGAATVEVLRERGLRLSSERYGEWTVAVDAAEHLDHPVDVCLVTVKATQLDAALERIRPDLLEGALVVPMLNGIEHVGLLRRRLPGAAVVAASIRVESTRTGPGEIRHDSPFAMVELATSPGCDAAVRRLAVHLERAGLDVKVREDEAGVLWDKLALLAPMALMTTRAAAPVGVVREEHRADLEQVVAEVTAVARAEGATSDAQTVLGVIEMVPASFRSSMQRDAAAGRPIELEAIGGAVLRAAARHGVPVPATTRVVQDLRG